MNDYQNQHSHPSTGLWVLVLICMGAIILALTGGAAYTGISEARLTAARASVGQIESVFLLADKNAQENDFRPPSGTFENLLKSYESTDSPALSAHEKFVLDFMLDTFGPQRDFDFAIKHFEDNGGLHTQIYYFPVKGHTNLSSDRYYLMKDGTVTANNVL